MKTSPLVYGVLFAALTSISCFAQVGSKKPSDDRVEKLLEELDLNYEIDKDGDFKLINGFDDDRTHVVFVNSKTEELGDLEIREVWSVGFLADTIAADTMQDLLEENGNVKLGAWRISRMGDKMVAIFSAQIAADTDRKSLLLALQAVSSTADNFEEQVTGKDDL